MKSMIFKLTFLGGEMEATQGEPGVFTYLIKGYYQRK